VTEFPPVQASKGRNDHDDDDDDDDDDDGGHIPNIVIIQAPPMVVHQAAPQPQAVRVVQTPAPAPVVIVRRRSFGSMLVYPIVFFLLFGGVWQYIRMRAARMAESAEKAVEKVEKGAEKKAPAHH
jgi:hypothetical protein